MAVSDRGLEEGLAEKVIFEPKEESESYGGRVLEAEGKEVHILAWCGPSFPALPRAQSRVLSPN